MTHEARAAAFLVAALVFSRPGTAAAEGPPVQNAQDARNVEDEDAPAALAAGAAVTFVSLGVGATLVARGSNHLVRNAGLLGGQSGMVLAPLAAHAVVGETKRGVFFSLPLLVPVAVNSVLTAIYPTIIRRAPAGIQYATFISVMVSLFGSSLGVLDAVRVSERKRPRAPSASSSLVIAPLFGDGMAGAFVAGSL